MSLRICMILIISVVIFSCTDKNPQTPQRQAITDQNILGKWYGTEKVQDGPTMPVCLSFTGNDTMEYRILNCDEEILVSKFPYSIVNGSFIFLRPQQDTATMNAFQMWFSTMDDSVMLYGDSYLAGEELHFSGYGENFVLRQSKTLIPPISVHGTVSVTGESSGGMIFVAAFLAGNTDVGQMTICENPGAYCIRGLSDGNYNMVAIFISRKYATTWLERSADEFPHAHSYAIISQGSSSNSVDFSINLSTGLTKKANHPPLYTVRYPFSNGLAGKVLGKIIAEFR